jgi:hypothetical protein
MADGTSEFLSTNQPGLFGTGDVDVFVPELWSKSAIVATESKLVFGRLVNRKFESELTMGAILHVPSITDLSSRTKTQQAPIRYESQDEAQTNITISEWIYSAIAVETASAALVDRDLFEAYSGKLGYALGLNVDDVLAGMPDGLGGDQTVGTLGVAAGYGDYLDAIQLLNDADVPPEDRYFVVSPAEQTGLMKMDRYTNNDYSNLFGDGPRQLGEERAYHASLLGIPVFVTTNVEGTNATGHDNTLFHKECFALAMTYAPRTHKQFDIDYLADKVVMEQLYGTQTMRATFGVFNQGA